MSTIRNKKETGTESDPSTLSNLYFQWKDKAKEGRAVVDAQNKLLELQKKQIQLLSGKKAGTTPAGINHPALKFRSQSI